MALAPYPIKAFVFSLFLTACGSSPAPSAVPPLASTEAAPTGAPAAPTASAGPSEAPKAPLEPLDLIASDAVGAVRIDLDRLRASPAFAEALKLVDTFPEASTQRAKLNTYSMICGFPLLEAVKEVVIAQTPQGSLIVIKPSVSTEQAMRCLRLSPEARSGSVGARRGVKLGGSTFVAYRGLLVTGDDEAVERALQPQTANGMRQRLDLGTDTIARGVADEAGPVRGLTADLRATDSALTFDARFTVLRGDLDVRMVKSQTAFLKQGPSPRARELLTSLGIDPNEMKRTAEGFVYDVQGTSRHVRLVVAGSGRTQAGILAAMVLSGIEQQAMKGQTYEARGTLRHIAQSLVTLSEAEGPSQGKFPVSAPSVPGSTEAIRGKAYTSTAANWGHASWKAIGFALHAPQRYAYSFATTPDRKHVVVRARGDLNGDGKLSLFELKVDIDATGVARVGELTEANPEE
ncbi:MAG: hypothetical protein WCI05_11050 [Myxococcales bacterium]